ncbi:MAG: hypothetical protein CMP24_03925 [Rickettsiales bacterium]|nr:hypothetical protein [Rickettsiales bacterium]|tara:strand:- start:365 stop:850 length:486 start_codon:yes stop_codon:yes gene_type:complete
MQLDYFKLPYGGQLLLWTSRILIYGSCRTKPNKYDLINMAYEKVGINKGNLLLKPFLNLLKNKKSFKIQHLNKRILIDSEIDLINCIEFYKKSNFIKNPYIELWDLRSDIATFSSCARNLALAYKKADLVTNLEICTSNSHKFSSIINRRFDNNIITKTLH